MTIISTRADLPRAAARCVQLLMVCTLLAGCTGATTQPLAVVAAARPAEPSSSAAVAPATPAARLFDAHTSRRHPLAAAARSQIGVTRYYDPAYVRLAYPGGDVDIARGVCTDVVIRALRTQGIDLQRRIHEDRIAHATAYPARWQAQRADSNIDHRRVPNQMAWFERQGWSIAPSTRAADYHGDDIVAWDLGGGVLRIGIVSDRNARSGRPLIAHNIGRGTQEQDILFDYRIIGHYRPKIVQSPVSSHLPGNFLAGTGPHSVPTIVDYRR